MSAPVDPLSLHQLLGPSSVLICSQEVGDAVNQRDKTIIKSMTVDFCDLQFKP